MNKIILVTLSALVLSCGQTAKNIDTSKDKELFNKNVKSFSNKFVAGFKSEDPELMMSLFADSLKWNNLEAVSGVFKSKQDLSEAINFYLNEFDDITFKMMFISVGVIILQKMKQVVLQMQLGYLVIGIQFTREQIPILLINGWQ